MKTRKLDVDGTPYTLKSTESGKVHTVRAKLDLATLQLIAEAFQAGWETGYIEGKRELCDDQQRIYVDGEDFTTDHQRQTN